MALTTSAPDTHSPLAPTPARRLLGMVVVGLLLSTFVSDSRLAKLPLQHLLKVHLHLSPIQMSEFFGLTSLAWYFKPIAGLLADAVPLWGSRRRNYLLLSGLGAGACWGLLGLVPRHMEPLVWTLVAANAFAVLASSVSGGLLVEAGRLRGWTGRLGTLRETIIAGTILVAQPIGGYLVGHAFGLTCGISAALFLGMVPAALLLLPERRIVTTADALYPRATWADIKARIKPVFAARALWLAALFIFLKDLSPGFGQISTPLYYYQTNVLHFDSVFLGWLGGLYNGCAIVGALLYGLLCTRVPLKTLLTVSIVLSVFGSLLFLGYHSHTSAIAIQAVSGLLGIFVAVALMDLAARAAPVGAEAMAYSLLMSAANLGTTGADIGGSWLFERLHSSLPPLIWISAGTTALALLALPLVPRAILARRDTT